MLDSLLKHILSISSDEEPSEEERLLAEIEETRNKLDCAWNHLNYASPEYVEIAVLELLIVETQYSLLNKRYRLLLGVNKDSPFSGNHAFYGTLSHKPYQSS
ncbi:MAG TPA: hypothetical protein VIM51_11240 [Desulfosporosinus sp.]